MSRMRRLARTTSFSARVDVPPIIVPTITTVETPTTTAQPTESSFSRFCHSAKARVLIGALAGFLAYFGATNKKDFGGTDAMGQNLTASGLGETEVAFVTSRATEAANLFRDYVLIGDPRLRQQALDIYNSQFRNRSLNSIPEFNNAFNTRMQQIDAQNPEYARMRQAAERDGSVVGQTNPVRHLQFIEAVAEARQIVSDGTQQTPPQSLDQMIAINGHRNMLTLVHANSPVQQARIAIRALREYILHGRSSDLDTFNRSREQNVNNSTYATNLATGFRQNILDDPQLGLRVVADAVVAHNNSLPAAQQRPASDMGSVVIDFITAVYAASGSAASTSALRDQYGANAVDGLLANHVRALAIEAATCMRTAVTADTAGERNAAAQRVTEIINSEFQSTTDSHVLLGNNSDFQAAFQANVTLQMQTYPMFQAARMSLLRNSLPIALREIYTELGKESPNVNTLLDRGYSQEMIDFVRSNYSNFSWLMRSEEGSENSIERVLQARASSDQLIRLINGIDLPSGVSRSHALADTYSVLAALRVRRNRLNAFVPATAATAVSTIGDHLGELSWLSDEATARAYMAAHPTDALVSALRGATSGMSSTPNSDPISVLCHAYRELSEIKRRRDSLETRYGRPFVNLISSRSADLTWMIRPVDEIGRGIITLSTQNGDSADAVRGLLTPQNQAPAHTSETLALTLRAIYRAITTGADVSSYSQDLVNAVRTQHTSNHASVAWLGGTQEAVRNRLEVIISSPSSEDTLMLRNFVYRLDVSQMISTVGRARDSLDRGGVVVNEARDQYGSDLVTLFSQTSRVAGVRTSQDSVSQLVGACQSTERELAQLEELMSDDYYADIRPYLLDSIGHWRDTNQAILYRAQNGGNITALNAERTRLTAVIVTQTDIDRAYDLANSMIRVAATGGGIGQSQNGATALGEFNASIAAFEALDPAKRRILGAAMAQIMRREARPIYDLVRSNSQDNYNRAIEEVYADITQANQRNRRALVDKYGQAFYDTVNRHIDELRFLEQPGHDMASTPSVVADELRDSYRRNDRQEAMVAALRDVYAFIRDRPSIPSDQQRTALATRRSELVTRYGEAFVSAVETNYANLAPFNTSLATVVTLEALPADLRGNLSRAFEAGDGMVSYRFTEQAIPLMRELPNIYAAIQQAVSLTTAANPETAAARFSEAVQLYRTRIGTNDYFFELYFNFPLLSSNVVAIINRYNLSGPGVDDLRRNGIRNVTDLQAFLVGADGRPNPLGQQLISRGLEFYNDLEQRYLQQRQSGGFSGSTDAELSDANVLATRSRLDIFTAAYLGIAMDRISGTASSFGNASATAVMNSIVYLANRDPYVVGAFATQVLPTLLTICPDETTLVATLTSFNSMLRQQFPTSDINQNPLEQRAAILQIFARIERDLPNRISSSNFRELMDEMRMTPEPNLGGDPGTPGLYRHNRFSPLWNPRSPVPRYFNPATNPLDLSPPVVLPQFTANPVPGGVARVQTGADVLHDRLRLYLDGPLGREFQFGVGADFRIGAVRASVISRELQLLFGSRPARYRGRITRAEGELGAFATGRANTTTVGGGVSARMRGPTAGGLVTATYTNTTTTNDTPTTAPLGTPVTDGTTTHRGTVDARLSGIPTALAGLIPIPAQGSGLRTGRLTLNYEGEVANTHTNTGSGTTVTTTRNNPQTRANLNGVLETYSRIAREHGDLAVLVAGQHVPNIAGSQNEDDRIRARIFYISQSGRIIQFGTNLTTDQINNYIYGEAEDRNWLVSGRVAPINATASRTTTGTPERVQQFDGAAIGFTIPATETTSLSGVAFGQLVRSISADPSHSEAAAGLAFASMLGSRNLNTFSLMYRGAQVAEQNPTTGTISLDRFIESNVEMVWRSVRRNPAAGSSYENYEARAIAPVGGPTVVGGMFRTELHRPGQRTWGTGVSALYNEVNLIDTYREIELQAQDVYTRNRNLAISLFGWHENRADAFGWLMAARYVHSELSDYVTHLSGDRMTMTPRPNDVPAEMAQDYGSLLFAFWARNHGVVLGAERTGFGDYLNGMFDQIQRAYAEAGRDPNQSQSIFNGLVGNLRSQMQRSDYRFAIGYRYDGESFRAYATALVESRPTVGYNVVTANGRTTTETNYGATELFGSANVLLLFGRPTNVYVNLLANVFNYQPVVLTTATDSNGNPLPPQRDPMTGRLVPAPPSIGRADASNYLSLYGSIGMPSIAATNRAYENRVTVSRLNGLPAAVVDCYRLYGSLNYSRDRLVRLYGEGLVDALLPQNDNPTAAMDGLSYLIRPVSEVATHLRQHATDPNSIEAQVLRYDQDASHAAATLVNIYQALRSSNRDLARRRLLQEQHVPEQLVRLVEEQSNRFDFMLLPPDQALVQIQRRAATSGSFEAHVVNANIPQPPARTAANGNVTMPATEVLDLFRRNMPRLTAAAMGYFEDSTTTRPNPDLYNVELGPRLARATRIDPNASAGVYFVYHVQSSEANGAGTFFIGNNDDLTDWMASSAHPSLGHGISRLEILPSSNNDYQFAFSGDRSERVFDSWRLVGGVTVPAPMFGGANATGSGYMVGGVLGLFRSRYSEWLAAAMHSHREFGNENWNEWRVVVSNRITAAATDARTQRFTWYVFFNRLTHTMVLAENQQDLRAACTANPGACQGLDTVSRTTGGAGATFARLNLETGSRLSFQVFGEAGVDTRSSLVSTSTAVGDTFVGRVGFTVESINGNPTSAYTSGFSITGAASSGAWPTIPGSTLTEQNLNGFEGSLRNDAGWNLGLWGTIYLR